MACILRDRKQIIDLTKTLDDQIEIYRQGQYCDPSFSTEDWCTHSSQGFWVSKLSLGTQTGTHIDAPAHFLEGAKCLGDLLPEQLIGAYFLIDPGDCESRERFALVRDRYQGQQIVFLNSQRSASIIDRDVMNELISLGAPLWLTTGDVEIAGEESFSFNRRLALAGVFLIEDLNREACQLVPPDGELIALPLKLAKLGGSPCRVVVRCGE